MRRPSDIAYGLEDRPPASVVVSTALQQATVVLIWVFPTILLARGLRATPAEAAALISMSFVVCGLGTMVQALRLKGLGTGMLSPVSMSSPHIIPALLAAKAGGLPMVAGMTIASGLVTILLAQTLTRIRTLIPPEIAGVVVLIIGLAICITGAHTLLDVADGEAPEAASIGVALVTLAVAAGLSVWGRGVIRWACLLFAMATGCVVAWAVGIFTVSAEFRAAWLPFVALPRMVSQGYAFDLALLPAFLIASLASALKTAGIVTTLQKLNDADWVRPDQRSIVGGVAGDGAASVLAGLLGTSPVNVSATNAAIQGATGVTSRVIAFATGAACLMLACFPAAAAAAAQMPAPVIAATLLYAGALMTAGGIQLAASRLLDTRRSLAIGLAIAAALAVETVPRLVEWLPENLRPLMTATGFGTLVALGLNALLRIGVRRSVTLAVPEGGIPAAELDDFVTRAGAAWGARREVVARLSHLVAACMDAIAVSGVAHGPVALTLTHDEATIALRIAYDGRALVLSDRPPTPDELLDDEDGPARLAGHMVRRLSDRLRQRSRGTATELAVVLEQ